MLFPFILILHLTDVDVPEPDEKIVMTYVSQLYEVFPAVPPKRTKTSSMSTTLKTSSQSVPAAASSSYVTSSRSEQTSSSASSNSVTNVSLLFFSSCNWKKKKKEKKSLLPKARFILPASADAKRLLMFHGCFRSENDPQKLKTQFNSWELFSANMWCQNWYCIRICRKYEPGFTLTVTK